VKVAKSKQQQLQLCLTFIAASRHGQQYVEEWQHVAWLMCASQNRQTLTSHECGTQHASQAVKASQSNVDVQGGCSRWMFKVNVQGGCSRWMFKVDVQGEFSR
jgi:hypothetical protein